MNVSRYPCIFIALFVSVPLALSQTTSNIAGRVTDPSGLIVPHVQVTAVNTTTHSSYSGFSNAEGMYLIQSLQPGVYRITFELKDFKKLDVENVDLGTGDTLPLDVAIEIGTAESDQPASGLVPNSDSPVVLPARPPRRSRLLNRPTRMPSVFQPATEREPEPPEAVATAPGPTPFGARFNLESRDDARPQTVPSIDFLANEIGPGIDLVVGVASQYDDDIWYVQNDIPNSRYYISRDVDDDPEVEGFLPPIPDPRIGGTLHSGGYPDVVVDPNRKVFFAADRRDLGIGVFRSPAATLKNSAICRAGVNSDEDATRCWPTTRLLFPTRSFEEEVGVDRPKSAVDTRLGSALGAGDVYVTAKILDPATFEYQLQLVACSHTLDQCSPSLVLTPFRGDQHELTVRPDGKIALAWSGRNFGAQIEYMSCSPAGAPAPPACGGISLVQDEPRSIPGRLALQQFTLGTRPSLAHGIGAGGVIETYVVWTRCKTALWRAPFSGMCPDADIVMKGSRDNGLTWSTVKCVACEAKDQFLPVVRTDRSRNLLNVAYYSAEADPVFQRRFQLFVRQISLGITFPAQPGWPRAVTALLNDANGDPYLGAAFTERIGLAARGTGTVGGSRAYIHFVYNNVQAQYFGVAAPESNNHLARVDY
jgi:hypothetical protein